MTRFLLLIVVFHSIPLRSFANQLQFGGEPSIPPGTLGISLQGPIFASGDEPIVLGPDAQEIQVMSEGMLGHQGDTDFVTGLYPPVHIDLNDKNMIVEIGQLGYNDLGAKVIEQGLVKFHILVSGSIFRTDPGVSNLNGGFTGSATSASLVGNTTPADLPPPLADLLAHPERIHVKAAVDGGHNNWLEEYIDIDPPGPTPVPEPSALAVFLAGAGAFHIVRRRARHNTRRSATASARPR